LISFTSLPISSAEKVFRTDEEGLHFFVEPDFFTLKLPISHFSKPFYQLGKQADSSVGRSPSGSGKIDNLVDSTAYEPG
jgi:hypothetical protein